MGVHNNSAIQSHFKLQSPLKNVKNMKTISACIFLAAIACANAAAVAEAEAQVAYQPQSAPLVAVGPTKPYSFAYEVVDPAGGNAYGHRETSDGAGCVEGEYRVVLPDTRTQIVKYSVCPDTGYVAQVTYEGTVAPLPARLVEKPVYRAAPGRA